MTTLAERIKKARNYAGLSAQECLARRLRDLYGLSIKQQTIQALERGRCKTTGYAAQIAGACGVCPIWLAKRYQTEIV